MSTAYGKVKAWRKSNREKVTEQGRRYRKKHPATGKKASLKYREKNIEMIRERDRIAQAKRRAADPEGQRRRYKKWRANKEAQLWELAGSPRAATCEICGGAEFRIVFDHCHAKGTFRGWICDQCNKVLGLVKDSTLILQNMINYLEKDNGKAKGKDQE